MRRLLLAASICVVLCACQTPEGGVVNKVLADFGLKDRPEGYESPADKALPALNNVGPTEMDRLNVAGRHGEVKFQEGPGLKGMFYKEVKVYEAFYPIEVTGASNSPSSERGFTGYIDYSYRMYQSPRVASKAEAENSTASIPTDQTGRERYRYNMGRGGDWDGVKGESVKIK